MAKRKMSSKPLLAVLIASAALLAHAKEIEVSQKGKTFMVQKNAASALRVNVGDTVSFRNDDPFFHNVFSASKVKEFDLGSYPQGQARKVVFDHEGGVDVECAIHPDMKLHIDVVK
jgi:plastocyanin